MVWDLHTKLSNKLALSAIFGLGLLCVPHHLAPRATPHFARNFLADLSHHYCSIPIIGGFRFQALLQVNFRDVSATLPNGYMWSMLEPPFAIICACLPITRPLLAKVLPKPFTNRSAKDSNKTLSWVARNYDTEAGNQRNFQHLRVRLYLLIAP